MLMAWGFSVQSFFMDFLNFLWADFVLQHRIITVHDSEG